MAATCKVLNNCSPTFVHWLDHFSTKEHKKWCSIEQWSIPFFTMACSLMKKIFWGLLIVLVQIHGHRACFEEERMGLLEFKEFVRSNADDADRLLLLPSWVDDSDSECCDWERVTCNSTTGHVIQLSLHNVTQISNYVHYIRWDNGDEVFYYEDYYKISLLNISIFQPFKELTSLDLSFNQIGGWIQNEGKFTWFTYFLLYYIC